MARILFLPVFLIILALIIFLALRVKTMFTLSKSRDITLSRPSPYRGDAGELTAVILNALNSLESVQYQSETVVNYRKITAFSRIGPGSGYCKISGRSASLEITRENGSLLVKTGKFNQDSIPRDNRWVDFWLGVGALGESFDLFHQDGMKVAAGETGTYTERNYTEIMVLAHTLSPRANLAFETCAPLLGRVYGINLGPGVTIRNFMLRVLVNSLTSLPDYIEVKFNIFKDGDFVSDYLQNSRLLY